MKELEKSDLMEINGGEYGYFSYTWSGTANPLIFAFEATANALKAVANGVIWVANLF